MTAALAQFVGARGVVGQVICHRGIVLLLIVAIRIRTLLVGHQVRIHAVRLVVVIYLLMLFFNVR